MAKKMTKATTKHALPAQASKTQNKRRKAKRTSRSVPACKIAHHMLSTKQGKTRKALPEESKVAVRTKKPKCKSVGPISGQGQEVTEIHAYGEAPQDEMSKSQLIKIKKNGKQTGPFDSHNHLIESAQSGLDESNSCIWEVMSPSSTEQASSQKKPGEELHVLGEILQQVDEATANKKKKERKKPHLLQIRKNSGRTHLKKDVRPVGSGVQEKLDQSRECVWEMNTSSSDQESTPPSTSPTQCQNSVLETSSEVRKTSVHNSLSITVVELGSDFGSGISGTVSLTTADDNPIKESPSTETTSGSPSFGKDLQTLTGNLFRLPQNVVSQEKFEKPAKEEQLLQSVVVVDLGNRSRVRSRECKKSCDSTSTRMKFREDPSEDERVDTSVQNLEDLSHDFKNHGHHVEKEDDGPKEFRSSTPKAKGGKRKRIKDVPRLNEMEYIGEDGHVGDQSRLRNESKTVQNDEQEMSRHSTPKLKANRRKRLKVSSEKEVAHSRHFNLEDVCNDTHVRCHQKDSKRAEKDIPENVSNTPNKKSGERKGNNDRKKENIKGTTPQIKATSSSGDVLRSAKPVNPHDVVVDEKDTKMYTPVQNIAKRAMKDVHKVLEIKTDDQSLQNPTMETMEDEEQVKDMSSHKDRQISLILSDLELAQLKENGGDDEGLQEISPDVHVASSVQSPGVAVEDNAVSPVTVNPNDVGEAHFETSPMDVTANQETQEFVSDTIASSGVSFRILKLSKSDQCLILLPHPSKFSFRGKVALTCIHGCITVNGFTISADDEHKSYQIYSPCSSCAVCIESSVECSTGGLKELVSDGRTLTEDLVAFLSVEEELGVVENLDGLDDGFAVALVAQKIPSDKAVEYVESFPGFGSLFSSPASKELSDTDDALSSGLTAAATVGLHPIMSSTPGAVFNTFPGYHDVTRAVWRWLHTSDLKPVVLVCGWKNTGKSTLSRYLTNSLLANSDGVCYLECDMAQTEFTPPGILSLQHVLEPLLGPPFSHIRKSERMCFYGDVTVRGDPDSYLQMVRYLFQHYQSRHADKPLIINTMGWMQGIGLQLLIDIIHITRPTHVIQLWSSSQPRLTLKITPESLEQTAGWCHQPDESNRTLSPEILEVEVPNTGDCGGGKYKASDHRTMALLSHLSDLQSTPLPDPPVALSSLTPLVLPWRCVAVHVTNGHVSPKQVMYALNGSIVGLCHANSTEMQFLAEDLPRIFDSTPVCRCLGLGIIRGIDPVQKVFYILTGVCRDALQEVNALLKGSITLPQSLLTQGYCTTDVPYVSQEFSSIVVGSSAIKIRRNIKQRGR